jgi:hypothetical protein
VKTRRFLIGIRGREFPLGDLSVMKSQTTLSTTTTSTGPVRDWSFVTASKSSRWSGGPVLEFVANRNWSFSIEGLYTKLRYTKVTTIAWGTNDQLTVTDDRSHMFRSEDTRAILWDVPVMVHHRFADAGLFSKLYVAAGAVARVTTSLSSVTDTTYPDTSTSTSKDVPKPSKRNLLGGVVGIGFRIIDDFNINWTPEIRYTRWAGNTFSTDSTVSPRNQIEVSLGFTF